MGEASWKRHEREVAKLLGGVRQPNAGRRGADVLSPEWAVEVKLRRRLPLWLARALDQAEAAAREAGRLPLLVLVHSPGRGRRARRYAILPLELLGEKGPKGGVT